LHKSIRRGIERIQQIDDRYLLLEFVAAWGSEPDCLRVIRRCRRTAVDAAETSAPAELPG
jgi:hypothetical protein